MTRPDSAATVDANRGGDSHQDHLAAPGGPPVHGATGRGDRLPSELMESHMANASEATFDGFRNSVAANRVDSFTQMVYRMGFQSGWRIREEIAAASSSMAAEDQAYLRGYAEGQEWQRKFDAANGMAPADCCRGSRSCSHACDWGQGWNAAMEQSRAAAAKEDDSEWVARVVSSGPLADLPCLEWRSADVSLCTPIGTKLYAKDPQ